MSTNVRANRIVARLARNLVAALAVTAIFAFKAAEPGAPAARPDLQTLAAR